MLEICGESRSSHSEPGPTVPSGDQPEALLGPPAEKELSALACVQWVEPESRGPPEGGPIRRTRSSAGVQGRPLATGRVFLVLLFTEVPPSRLYYISNIKKQATKLKSKNGKERKKLFMFEFALDFCRLMNILKAVQVLGCLPGKRSDQGSIVSLVFRHEQQVASFQK